MKAAYRITVLLLPLLGFLEAAANNGFADKPARDTLNPLIELIKIEGRYGDTIDKITVMQHYVYEYIEGSLTSLDSNVSAIYTREDFHKFLMDSLEILQDQQYNVAVNHDDSVMVVSAPIALYKVILQVDLLDTNLHLQQIHDLTLTDSANTHIIQFEFTNESPFISYKVVKDTGTHRIYYTDFIVKKIMPPAGIEHISPAGYTDYTRYYTIFLEDLEPFEPLDYSTGKFIKPENGKLVAVAPYDSYEVIDYTRQE